MVLHVLPNVLGIMVLLEGTETVPSKPFRNFFPQPQIVSSHPCAEQSPTKNTRWSLCRCLSALLFSGPLSYKPQAHRSPQTLSSLSTVQGVHEAPHQFSTFCVAAGTFSPESKLGTSQGSPYLFVSFQRILSLLAGGHCFENFCFMHFVWFLLLF